MANSPPVEQYIFSLQTQVWAARLALLVLILVGNNAADRLK